MNILYESIYPASLLPWAIICLFYFVHGYIFLFLTTFIHISTHLLIIFHFPYKWSMIEINRMLHVQRLVLWLVYAFRNQWNQHLLSFLFFLSIGINIKLVNKIGDKLMSFPVHLACVMAFCSTSNLWQLLLAIACTGIYYLISKPIDKSEDVNRLVQEYFYSRMAYTYAFALVEWSVSEMNGVSLLFIIIAVVIFNASILFHIPKQDNPNGWYEYSPAGLPIDYPFPLNIKNAMDRCNTAKKLFKSHDF